MSKRLDILKNSLTKKESILDDKFKNHFATVRLANGQPLNDKRNGQSTLNKWDRQSNSIKKQYEEIEKTKDAIRDEENKIKSVLKANSTIPKEITELIELGKVTQWRKHPNYFFVEGVDKARIVWDVKKKKVLHKYTNFVTGEQRKIFAKVFNELRNTLNTK